VLRKRRCRPETSLEPAFQQEDELPAREVIDQAPDPEQMYDQHQRCARLMQAVQRLPTNLQEAVQTHMTADCSIKEVASKLNISQAAVKSRLYRARRRLGSSTPARYGPRAEAAAGGRAEAFPG
jgi:RNA polymerase sigma-70 factor, ECF subfamily